MFSANKLTDQQKQQIHQWAAEGDQLQDIQKKVVEDLGHPITYMDTRFLVLDLGVEILTEKEEVTVDPVEVQVVPTGSVQASVDEVVRPGALVSGRVTFSDGEKALWAIDQMGRLSLDADTPGYQPDEEDMITFQEKLRDMLAR